MRGWVALARALCDDRGWVAVACGVFGWRAGARRGRRGCRVGGVDVSCLVWVVGGWLAGCMLGGLVWPARPGDWLYRCACLRPKAADGRARPRHGTAASRSKHGLSQNWQEPGLTKVLVCQAPARIPQTGAGR